MSSPVDQLAVGGRRGRGVRDGEGPKLQPGRQRIAGGRRRDEDIKEVLLCLLFECLQHRQ